MAIGGVIVALHIGVLYYLAHRPPEPVAVAAPAPLEVQLTQPVPVEPPKPLPQKKMVQPPPPPPPQTPHINLPPPPPTPLPAVESPAAPVVQAPPPAPVVPPPPAPVPEKITPAAGYAGYLNNPQPEFPQFAIDQGWEGRVLLHVHVLANGRADRADIVQTSGHKVLDESARNTVKLQWTFMPAKRGDTPIDGWVNVPIDFKLSN